MLPAVEVGWRLARDAWGRGYATEAARAALAFGFEEHAIEEILAIVDPGNERSLRVCAKLGMTRAPGPHAPRDAQARPRLGRPATLVSDTSTRGRQASTWSVPYGWSRAEVPEAS